MSMKKILYLLPLLFLLASCQENPDYGAEADPMVAIEEDSLTILVGDTRKLTLSVRISGVKWNASDSTVAWANYQGRVTAEAVGKSVIYAERGAHRDSCVVTVVEE